jgi:hypothetical protein
LPIATEYVLDAKRLPFDGANPTATTAAGRVRA